MNEQIQILGGRNPHDRALVEEFLVSAAIRFSMVETPVTARVPKTIRCYSERYGGGFAAGARVHGELVVVDLVPGQLPSARFAEVKAHFITELNRLFGDRSHVAAELELVKWQSTLPISEASREFHRKLPLK
jgi:hypothetical protein